MITRVFSVYDSKALAYNVPFFMPSVGAAVRAFADLSNDSNTTINKHPTDYVLYEIGTYNDENGVLTPIQPFVNLGIAADFVVRIPAGYADTSIIKRNIEAFKNADAEVK